MKTTTLEDLSNEILIDILEYIASPGDVYRAFITLNHRFDTLLRSVRLHLDVFWEDRQSRRMIRCFSSYCNCLRVHNVCPSISLTDFSRLRSVTINEPTDAQIESIQSTTLPMLEYLASPASMTIFDCLFGNREQQWLFLHSCNFYFSHFPHSKLTWQPNRAIRTFSGVTCSRTTLSQLLSLLPCLQHLRIEMIANDSSKWNLAIFDKTLSSLRIGVHQLNYDDLYVLMGPHLHRLHIEIFDHQSPLDFTLLGTVIMSATRTLKQFICVYRGMEVSIDLIKNAHTLFQNIQFMKSHARDTNSFICRDMM